VFTELIRPQALSQLQLSSEAGWVVAVLEMTQAEQLLDWLESHGCNQPEVSMSTNGRLAIRYCLCPDSTP
jgi:hypothetical protein